MTEAHCRKKTRFNQTLKDNNFSTILFPPPILLTTGAADKRHFSEGGSAQDSEQPEIFTQRIGRLLPGVLSDSFQAVTHL